jgi:predicted nucleic acid-binding protein
MDVVIDTSAVIAVITGAPEKPALVAATRGASLIAPSSVHWEVGNAFSAMVRRKRIEAEAVRQAVAVYRSVPIRFVEVDLGASLEIALRYRLYAYDAYLIECALITKAPLLTLDGPLRRVAAEAGAALMDLE